MYLNSVIDSIKKWENHSPKAYWDVNHYRIGFGSDTRTINNKVYVTKQGDVNTLQDSINDLTRRVKNAEQLFISKYLHYPSLTDGEKVVIHNIYYNYGKLPLPVKNAIINNKGLYSAVANLINDNVGIRKKRYTELLQLVRKTTNTISNNTKSNNIIPILTIFALIILALKS
jgi:hypothetical protein